MLNFLHDPKLVARLRPLKPLYHRLTGRRARAGIAPADCLEALGGRAVFLLSFGRSGTTVFCEFMRSHPDMRVFGEILNEDAFHNVFGRIGGAARRPSVFRARFYRHLKRLVDRNPHKLCLFDLKFESLHLIEGNWRMPGPDFEILQAIRDSAAPAILIERRDGVARHLSLQMAARSQRFHSYQTGNGAAAEPFDIDIAAMDREIDLIRAQHARVREIFAGAPRFLDIAYEEMLVDDPATGKRRFAPEIGTQLAALLGCRDAFDPAPRLDRVSGSGAPAVIRNMAEVEVYRAGLAC